MVLTGTNFPCCLTCKQGLHAGGTWC